MPTKNLKDFCSGSLLEGRAEILQIFGRHFGRNDDLINSEFNWPLPKVGWQVVMVGSQSASSGWERVNWSAKTYLSGQLPALPTHLLRPCINEFNITELMFKRMWQQSKWFERDNLNQFLTQKQKKNESIILLHTLSALWLPYKIGYRKGYKY